MKPKATTGFTLIEVLIAVGLLGMLITAIYSIWTSIMVSTRAAQQATADLQRARIAIESIEDALLSVQMYSENIRHYPFVVDHWNESSTLSLTCRLPDSFPGAGLYGDQVVRRVNFSVEADTDGTKKLVMSQMPILFATNETIQPYSIDLARDVQFFVLEFWDARLNEWTEDLLTTNIIPRIVRITLGVGKQEQTSVPKDIFARTVAIPSIAVPRELQLPNRAGGGGSPTPLRPNQPNPNPNAPGSNPRGNPQLSGRDVMQPPAQPRGPSLQPPRSR